LTTSPAETPPIYVADTNVLIWYLTNHPKLSKQVEAIFEAARRGEAHLVVSAISVAEMFFSDKKFGHFTDFAAVYSALKARPEFEFVPFHPDDVLDFEQDAAVPEMHDRIITGLARRLGVPVLTNDPLIIQSGLVKVEW
jgi:PIN domain nuclease of toxin-antitoxin system